MGQGMERELLEMLSYILVLFVGEFAFRTLVKFKTKDIRNFLNVASILVRL